MSLAEYKYVITDKHGDIPWEANEYKIVHENSGGGTFSTNGSQATVSYIFEYDYVFQALEVLLGKTVKFGSTLRRSAHNAFYCPTNGSMPDNHPYFFNYWASSATLNPYGTSSNAEDQYGVYPKWNKAVVNVVYKPLDYNVIEDDIPVTYEYQRFTSVKPEGTAEFQTSQGLFYFLGDNPSSSSISSSSSGSSGSLPIAPLNIQPGQIIPATKLTYTWHQIPCAILPNGYPDLKAPPNFSNMFSLVGKVNSVTFDNYPPGTVLFAAPATPRLIPPASAQYNAYYWEIDMTFGVRNYGVSPTPYVTGEYIGWNYAYSPIITDKRWRLYTSNGSLTGDTMYQYGDLNNLFAVTW